MHSPRMVVVRAAMYSPSLDPARLPSTSIDHGGLIVRCRLGTRLRIAVDHDRLGDPSAARLPAESYADRAPEC